MVGYGGYHLKNGVVVCWIRASKTYKSMQCSSPFPTPIVANHSPLVVLIPRIAIMVCKKTQKKMIKGEGAQFLFPKFRSSASKAACAVRGLCVVETLLFMLSLGGSQSSLCHLCVEAIVKRIADPENSDFDKHLADHWATLCKLNKQYADTLEQLEAEKQRGRELKELEKVTRGKSLLDAPIDNLNLQELEILQQFMGEVKGNLLKQIEELSIHNKNPTSSSAKLAEAPISPARASSSAHVNGHGF